MSQFDDQEHDPVANLHMQPVKGILKTNKSVDDPKQDGHRQSIDTVSSVGMTRSESKSHKIPHFDEMNIIATYHPPDKDYGHMKIEEPKTPYAPNDLIDEEMETDSTRSSGIDPSALAEKLKQSTNPSGLHVDHSSVVSIEDEGELGPEDLEHRKEFEKHRKRHYNEFEVVRLRRKEIEEELRALEREDQSTPPGIPQISVVKDSIKPILVHHDPRDSSCNHHHVHVEEDLEEDQNLTPEERERKRQFEMKRKKHYNEFRAARLADQDDDQ